MAYNISDANFTQQAVSLWGKHANGTEVNVSDGCVVIVSSGIVPWNNPKDVVKVEVQVLFNNVKAMIIVPIFFFISAPTNILSMVVFAKHGLSHRTNVCLFTLSLVDLLYGVISFCMYVEQLWSNLLTDPPYFGGVTQFITNQHVLGFYGFSWVSLFVSALVAVERCLCVVWPIRSQTLLKTKTIWGILFVGTLAILAITFTVGEKFQVVCAIDEKTQSKRLIIFASDFYMQNTHILDMLEFTILGLFWPIFAVSTVAIASSVTAFTLKKAIAWRLKSSVCATLSISAKEIALTKMLVCLSVQFVIFNIPNIVFRIVGAFMENLSNYGNYYNLYFVCLGFVEIMNAMNTSLNFFIYFFAGSKYRETVMTFFCKKKT